MGYKFQFVTLAGFHALNHRHVRAGPRLPRPRAWPPTRELQQAEFAAEADGYTATRHQREVGTGYFDEVTQVISGGAASTLALKESTEAAPVLSESGRGADPRPGVSFRRSCVSVPPSPCC